MDTGYTQFLHVQKKQAHSEFLFWFGLFPSLPFKLQSLCAPLLLDGTLCTLLAPCTRLRVRVRMRWDGATNTCTA